MYLFYHIFKNSIRKIKTFQNHFGKCDESAVYAPLRTQYLIENILNFSNEDINKKYLKSTFRDNSLGDLICIKYNDSAFAAITDAYPEKNFYAWDFVNAP